MVTHITLVLLLTILTVVKTRIYENSYPFTRLGNARGWIFIDKMTFAPGTARIVFQTTVTGTPKGRSSQIFIQAVPEDKWQKEKQEMCRNPPKLPLAVHNLNLDGTSTISSFPIEINDYKTYYFVMKDCQSRFVNDYNNPDLFVAVKLHMLNNEREVGEEEDHWYIVPFIFVAGVLLIIYYYQQYKKEEEHDWSKNLLFGGILTQILSLFWKSCGFLLYSYTGSDHQVFHFIYLFLHSTSESTVISLLVLIGFGWTLSKNFQNEMMLLMPLVSILGFINIVITMTAKIGHSYDRHHMFDSVGGTIVIIFRLIFIGLFICGVIYSCIYGRINQKGFIMKLAVMGLFYIGSMPVIVWLANYLIDAKNRHEFVFITVQIVKFTTNLVLAYQLSAKRSTYSKVNVKDSSFLPKEQSGF